MECRAAGAASARSEHVPTTPFRWDGCNWASKNNFGKITMGVVDQRWVRSGLGSDIQWHSLIEDLLEDKQPYPVVRSGRDTTGRPCRQLYGSLDELSTCNKPSAGISPIGLLTTGIIK